MTRKFYCWQFIYTVIMFQHLKGVIHKHYFCSTKRECDGCGGRSFKTNTHYVRDAATNDLGAGEEEVAVMQREGGGEPI